MEEKIGKEGETGKDSICWAISAKVGFVSCFGRQGRWRGQVELMKLFVMGRTFLVQEPFWLSLLIPGVLKQLTWKT